MESQINFGKYEVEDCKLIKIPNNQQNNHHHFFWEEEGREFTYQNRWYDVIHYFTANDTTYFYCLNDIIEQRFVARFQKDSKSQWEASKINISKLLQIENYFPSKIENSYSQANTSNILFIEWVEKDNSVFINKHAPPPKVSI